MTTFTSEDKLAAEKDYHPDGFVPMAGKALRPMTFADIQKVFDITLSTTDSNYNAAELIDFVRKVEKFHGIG